MVDVLHCLTQFYKLCVISIGQELSIKNNNSLAHRNAVKEFKPALE